MRVKLLKADGRALSIVAIVCFILLAIALLIAHASPATGYELDIYNATPLSVWVCLFLSFIGGISILGHQIATKGYRDSRFWLIGLLVLILARMSVLYLPYIRGYISWGGDNISQLGMIKDILSSGHFPTNAYYPITHVLLSSGISVTGIPDIILVNLSTTFLSVMFVLSTYLLATAVLPHKGQQLLAALVTGGVMLGGGYNVFLMPNGWSILLMPLLFYCYFKRAIAPYTILFAILLVLYPFFHPLSALVVIISLGALELSRWLLPRILKPRATLASSPDIRPSPTPMLIELTIFLPWVLSFQQFHPSLRLMWQQITTGVGPEVIAGIETSLSKVNVHGMDFVTLLFKMYGVTIIFLILALIGIFFLWRQVRSGSIGRKEYDLACFASVLLVSGIFYGYYLSGGPGSGALAGERLLFYVAAFTPVFAAFALYELFKRLNFRRLAWGGIICLVILSSVLSIRSLYRSPYIIQPNLQITQMEMTGMIHLIKEKDTTIGCAHIMRFPYRFADGILGTIETNRRGDLSYNVVQPSDHLGYDEHSTLGEQYSQNRYAAITKFDRILYTTVWHEVGRFNDADFERLEQDPTVDKLYSNGELDVYLIHSSGGIAE